MSMESHHTGAANAGRPMILEPAIAPMTIERAIEINAAICDFSFVTMGLKSSLSTKALTGLSLRQMLDAVEIVEAANSSPSIDGKRTIHIVPDQRLVAAVYCLEHYEPRSEAILAVPHGDFAGNTRYLGVMAIDREDVPDEED